MPTLKCVFTPPLETLLFAIQNHHGKAPELYNTIIWGNFKHASGLWPKFAKFPGSTVLSQNVQIKTFLENIKKKRNLQHLFVLNYAK